MINSPGERRIANAEAWAVFLVGDVSINLGFVNSSHVIGMQSRTSATHRSRQTQLR